MFGLLNKNSYIYTLFFCGFFFYIQFIVDPTLYYFNQNPEFFTHFHFFKQFIQYPGGLTEYVSLYLTTLMILPVIAAVIITCLVIIITTLTVQILKASGVKKPVLGIALFPVIIITGLHGNLGHSLSFNLLLILMLSNYLLYRTYLDKNILIGLVNSFVLSALILFIGGIIPFGLFICMVVIGDLTKRPNPKSITRIVAVIIFTFALPYVFYNYLFMRGLTFEWEVIRKLVNNYTVNYIPIVPLLYYPVVIALIPYRSNIVPVFCMNYIKKWRKIINSSTQHSSMSSVIQFVLIIILTITISAGMFDKHYNKLYKMHKMSSQQKWSRVEAIGDKCKSDDIAIHLMRNRALYHERKLLDHLFDKPQNFGIDGLMFSENFESRMLIPHMLNAYDLGDINQSIRWAYEVIAHFGYCPRALKQLVLANIIKENYNTATKLLQMLKCVPFQKKWTNHHLELVENPGLILKENKILKKRKLLPQKIYSDKDNISHLTILKNLLYNEKNQAAFEYLLMSLLLEQKIDEFVSYLSYMEHFNYKRSPKHIQEALCVYISIRKDTKKNILGNLVTMSTWTKFQEFSSIKNSDKKNLKNTKDKLRLQFGNTYWYYMQYIYPEIAAIKKNPDNDNPYIVKQ